MSKTIAILRLAVLIAIIIGLTVVLEENWWIATLIGVLGGSILGELDANIWRRT